MVFFVLSPPVVEGNPTIVQLAMGPQSFVKV